MLKIDTNIKPIYAHSIEEFNSYVDKYKCDTEMVLTKSGNLSQINLRKMPCYKVWKRGNRMELHYMAFDKTFIHIRVIYALHYDVGSDTDDRLAYEALTYFKGLMDVIPTDDKESDCELFTCPENPDSAYYNFIDDRWTDMVVTHCYSLDRNNSFPASMVEVYPQTKPWVDRYYNERLKLKQDAKILGYEELVNYYKRFKLYGSIFVGWLKRKGREKAWKKIISNSNKKVHELRKYIEQQGNEVLLVNTDAVKFRYKVDYNETTDLGGFKYEWKDTKMYIKGIKSYGFVNEKGKWEFRQAGKTRLDRIKPDRTTWTFDEYVNGVDGKYSVIKIDSKTKHLVEVFE